MYKNPLDDRDWDNVPDEIDRAASPPAADTGRLIEELEKIISEMRDYAENDDGHAVTHGRVTDWWERLATLARVSGQPVEDER